MNIKQAVERVSELRSHIEQMESILTMLKRREESDKDVHIDIWNPSQSQTNFQSQRRAMLSRTDLIDALAKGIRAHESEVNRLQPIIDMANLALKGAQV